MASFQMLNTHSTFFFLFFISSIFFFRKKGGECRRIRFLFRLPDDDNSSTTRSVFSKIVWHLLPDFLEVPFFCLFVQKKISERKNVFSSFFFWTKRWNSLFSPNWGDPLADRSGRKWSSLSGVVVVERALVVFSYFLDSFLDICRRIKEKAKSFESGKNSISFSDLKLFSIFNLKNKKIQIIQIK